MPASQRLKKDNATPVGKAPTLRSFFGSTSQLTQTQAPPKPVEIIVIDSDDENAETSPAQSKRKCLHDPDSGTFSSGSKKGKPSRSTAQFAAENDSPLKSVPPSSLNRTITTVGAELCLQANQMQQTTNLAGDWEMGDDEFLDLVDDSEAVNDQEDNPENALDTCPICGAIFVDFCLSVSVPFHPC